MRNFLLGLRIVLMGVLLLGVYQMDMRCLVAAIGLLFVFQEWDSRVLGNTVDNTVSLMECDTEIIDSLRDHEHGVDGSAVMVKK